VEEVEKWARQAGVLGKVIGKSILTLLPPFNGLFSRTIRVSQHQKGKPFWILLEQEMMGWQWHQLDHTQIICTSLQTDNHASTSRVFLQAGCPSCRPTNSIKTLKAKKYPYFGRPKSTIP